ncbi:actin-related protein 2/3 complex subunit 2 [Cladochytrium replicatum]|nr:actin-related protein 2/3 complex subunit 2 [Cladochytrium replicatum]
MHMGCFPELQRYGADDVLRKEYGSLLHSVGSGGDSSADVVLKIDSKALGEDIETVVKKVAHLKRNALAAPFEKAFSAQIAGEGSEWMTVNYRDEEIFFVQAQADRVTVIFSTTFKDETDRIFGKVFLQEFVDARRQPSIQNAPQVLYSPREPPLELRGVAGLRDSENIAYVTFVLFPRHFATDDLRRDAISRIQVFRDYLHYHIKCSKAYMHSRMRARVDSFLKVLNRAKPEKPDDQKEKKTASGRTFKMR